MAARLSRPTCFSHANAHSARTPIAVHERIAETGPSLDAFPGFFDKSEILPEANPVSGSVQQQQQDPSSGPGRILLLDTGEGDREVLSNAARLLHPSISSLICNGSVKVSGGLR